MQQPKASPYGRFGWPARQMDSGLQMVTPASAASACASRAGLAAVRHALGEQASTAAWVAGHALSLEEAISCALAGPDRPLAPRTAEEGGEPPAGTRQGRRPRLRVLSGHETEGTRPRSHLARGVLTPREYEVAALIADGHTNREIGETLVISLSTAERHVANILNKLLMRSRTDVAVWARDQGLQRRANTAG